MKWVSGASWESTTKDGIATILNGNANVVVAHGLPATPIRYKAFGTTADTASLYIDTVGAANMTIHAADGVVGADRTVIWYASCWGKE